MASKTTVLGVKLERASRDRLKRLGERRDRSPHWLARKAILDFIEREERHDRERAEDEERWRAYVEEGEYLSEEEMDGWLRRLERETKKA
jgi:predicted transcriptional regulator